MKMKTTKVLIGMVAVCMAFGALADGPTISDVVVRQRWPWNRLVDINYVLSCESTQSVDIVVTGYNGATALSLPVGTLSGDLYNVSDGSHRIVWDPTASAYTNSGVLTKFRVQLTPTPVPVYMIVDLTKDVGADGQIEYVYESDLTNGLWGAWVRNPVTNTLGEVIVESVVWTGVTNNDIYKTDKLVLRRVPAGSYTMGGDGYPTCAVTLTKACYAGVFEVTGAQWAWVMGSSGTSNPKSYVSYDDIRGATTSSIDWPKTGSGVSPTCFLSRLRSATGITDFDLPTEAQWEYLCRAGTTTVFNDGSTEACYDGILENNNGNTNSYLSVLGWYKWNCVVVQPVGQKVANAWGLYDAAWEHV